MQGSLHSSWALPNFDMVRHGISTTSTCAPTEEASGARLTATSAAANAYTPPRPRLDAQQSTQRTKRPKSRKPQIDRSALHYHLNAAFRKLEEARLALIDVAAKAHYDPTNPTKTLTITTKKTNRGRRGGRRQRGKETRVSPIERGVAGASREAKKEKTEKNEKAEGGWKNKKKKEEGEGEEPSLRKRVRMAEARARKAENEAKELKTKLDAAIKAAADGPQVREDPTLRGVSTEVALFALESDVRIKTQELREAQVQSEERQGRARSYGARISQLEGQLEAERERREKAEVEQQASGWRDQLSEARQRTEAAKARAEQAGGEIAGWQVAGEFAKAKVRQLQLGNRSMRSAGRWVETGMSQHRPSGNVKV